MEKLIRAGTLSLTFWCPNKKELVREKTDSIIMENPQEGSIDPVCVAYVDCTCGNQHRISIT